ncbi:MULTISPECIES: ABC transporter permease [Herbiconiux]|jgi:simple sugar transport system permease protein|uniref:Simple sugar transport system permease protein n=1 Tax=Herbiconiux flava TaxID=881268 RepID=A0A852SNX4_9MICO|nr:MULTISPECIES: ABC transporter permease [Herbiconiux]NQX36402.1 ABC transporter permease [Herbiconiux sp. VKM Ac-2851]NYD70519.1 simple sugar transport system permease protein [Herbiconiux flava]GLK17272.1 ABC transporter permease [Herbiconiux flava]
MSVELWVAIIAGALALAAPLVLAGIGEGFVERAGRINLGIEGMMIMGALTGVWAGSLAGPLAGLVAGLLVGLVLAVVMNLLVYRLHANEIVIGLGITMLGLGLSTYLYQLWVPSGQTNVAVATVPRVDLGPLSELPVVGPILFGQSPLVYLAVVLLVVAWAVMRFTRFGLAVQAVGTDPASAALRGVRVERTGASALLIGGALAGLGGAVITVGTIGSFTPDITAGRGYIVLAVVIMGRSRPIGIALGALLFAFLQSFALLSQSTSLQLPSELYQSLPYLVTLVVLVITSRSQMRRLFKTVRPA